MSAAGPEDPIPRAASASAAAWLLVLAVIPPNYALVKGRSLAVAQSQAAPA